MAGLKKTFEGTVTFLGVNSSLDQDLVSAALSEVQMTFAGFEGEDHGGLTRSACSRLRNVHPKGTPLKNQRQLTVLSVEEMAEVIEREYFNQSFLRRAEWRPSAT